MLIRAWLLIVGLVISGWAFAEDKSYNRVGFSVQAQDEVENDQIVAILYLEKEGSNAGNLADDVNQGISWAIKKAKRVDSVKVQTQAYQTYPVHGKLFDRWRVRQTIRLESRNAAVLSDLVGLLQKQLAVQSLDVQLSAAARKAKVDKLLGETLARFRARAALLSRELNFGNYRIVRIDINTSERSPRLSPRKSRSLAMSGVSPPAIEKGMRTVTVTASGVIELTNE